MSTECNCGCGGESDCATANPTANRPGLPALSYRVGTHGTFFETMKERLSTLCLGTETECRNGQGLYPLRRLTTRDPGDPAIALLDTWAVVGDVLTFYQERIANEGYLRTATERRSILELSRLIGYNLRPGVASSVYLAYTLDEDRTTTPPKPTATTVPKGSRVQSVPGPGESPQSFETSEDLEARSEWNKLGLRQSQPQTKQSIKERGLFLKGTNTQLKTNDALLIDFGDGKSKPLPVRVVTVEPQPEADRTLVNLRLWRSLADAVSALRTAVQLISTSKFPTTAEATAAEEQAKTLEKTSKLLEGSDPAAQADFIKKTLSQLSKSQSINQQKQFAQLESILNAVTTELELARESFVLNDGDLFQGQDLPVTIDPQTLSNLLPSLLKESSVPPASRLELPRKISANFVATADGLPQILGTLRPTLAPMLYRAWGSALALAPAGIKVYVFRTAAPIFGYNAPRKPLKFNREDGSIAESGEWPVIEGGEDDKAAAPLVAHEEESFVNLDTSYDKIQSGSWVMVETTDTKLTTTGLLITRAQSVNASGGRSEYGITGKTTRIVLGADAGASPSPTWIQLAGKTGADTDFNAIRRTTVYAQGEELELAEEPIETPVGLCDPMKTDSARILELSGLYDKLAVGRWLIVSGERVIPGTSGVIGSELVMLAAVENKAVDGLPGDKIHTFLHLGADGLAYCYKRDTVTIYGNVINATHGETRTETANGDARQAFQEFALKQAPLTYVSAPNPSGAESTLQLRVNDVLWHETDTLASLEPTEHRFITRTDDDAKTTAITGDGKHGARLPTGQENIRLIYRNGIGQPGNVKARQISLLVTRPLNVKDVINPLPATGGADKEPRDLARVNAPLAVTALDRLVSIQDYADFSRTFAGLGKASSAALSDGQRQIVHVTVAGADDIPIATSSDLYRNLNQALHESGDPFLPIQVVTRQLLLLILEANVRVLPDYLWAAVEPKVRAALLDTFSFNRRDLGQDALLSEVFRAIQSVEGVAYADVDVFDAVDETKITDALSAKPPLEFARQERIAVQLAAVDPQQSDPKKRLQAAQLAYFTPAVPDTLILKEIES